MSTATKTVEKSTNEKVIWGSDLHLHTSFWQQEVNRYRPSVWLLVKFAVLYTYFKGMTDLGGAYWPRIVQYCNEKNIDPADIALPGAMGLAFTFFAIYGYGFFGFINYYCDDWDFFKRIRIHKGDWAWVTDPREDGSGVYSDMFKAWLFNNSLYIPTFPLVKYVIGTSCPFRTDADSLPGYFELIWQVAFSVVCFDVVFYHIHRMLHHKDFYWIHRKHHSVTVVVGPVGAFYHPIDEWLEAITASLFGPLLLWDKMHIVSFQAWFVFAIWAALEIHCGYELPWNMYQALPFSVDARYHDFHHRYHHRGNYAAVFTIWDYIYGTNKEYYEWVRNGGPFEDFTDVPFDENNKVQQKKLN
ncbi:Fatty acid hydroxylase domain-containing protein 2 [Seminavis robusta]|uniref:Fatty acid hydroxylase domain-containing protein 2 n=1 Tax=Seminavis robusta TaxID=568900 RepID=A0A9N8DZE2_9STRA|nr:Fatty acid hydroxylase domain-containing protein 2 [Seminavis robusta]|eukprot:Sro498_g154960.1 Fatty acid hydroxylase domain-containing protein 2 (357) ;mRNA; f:59396-60571